MRVIPVDRAQDPRLVELTGLSDASARSRIEAEHGCFVAEGILTLAAVVDSAHPLRSVLVAESKLARVAPLLADVDVDVFVAPAELLEAVAGFPIHRGVIASASRLPLAPVSALVEGATRVLVIEGVNDHENLGALFRNAAAFAVDAVILDPTCADPLYRRSVRVSLGHVLRVPWTRTLDMGTLARDLASAGLRTLALTPRGTMTVAQAVGAHRGSPVAWIVGAEGPGLPAATLDAADATVRIPMRSDVDSVNVATAAAIALAFDPLQD